jgi:hypothetical protein
MTKHLLSASTRRESTGMRARERIPSAQIATLSAMRSENGKGTSWFSLSFFLFHSLSWIRYDERVNGRVPGSAKKVSG